MSISFTCSGCGKQFHVAQEAAGRLVKCATCGTKIQIPAHGAATDAAPTPSMELDWDLMQSASRPVPEAKAAAAPKDPDAVDWDAIAAPLSEMTTQEESTRNSRNNSRLVSTADGEMEHRADATNHRFKPGRIDYFLIESLLSLPAGVNYLPQIFAILMIGLGVGIVMGVLSFGFLWMIARNPEPWLVIAMIIVVLTPLFCFYGYVARFWTSVADDASEGHMGTSLPDIGIGEMARAIFLWVLFFFAYILPIFTIPLAPVAFLAMGRTNDYQAFNLRWVAQSTLRCWLYVLIVLCFIPFFLVVFVIAASLIFPSIAEFSLSMTKDLNPRAQDFVLSMFLHFTMLPVIMMFIASICRATGLIGKFNPVIYHDLPKRGRILEGGLLAVAGLALAVLVTYPVLSSQRDTVVTPMVRYVVGKPAMATRQQMHVAGGRPSGTPVQITPPPPRPIIDPEPDFSKMGPLALVQYHTSQVRSHDAGRSRKAMIWLASAQTIASQRPAVVNELEQAIRTGRFPDLALTALEKWSDDPTRLLLSQLQSSNLSERMQAANVLATVPPDEQKRAEVADRIARLIPQQTGSDAALALLRAYEHWAVDPFEVLAAELKRGRPHQVQIMEALARLSQPRAAKELVAHMCRNPNLVVTASQLLRTMPAQAQAEMALIEALGSGVQQTVITAAQALETMGTPASLPALRELSSHQAETIAKAARGAIRRMAPQEMTPAREAVLDLLTSDARLSTRSRAALLQLAAMEVAEEDRAVVIDGLMKKLESQGRTDPRELNAAFKQWADEGTVDQMLKQLAARKDDVNIRRSLLLALGAIGHRKSILSLVDFLDDDPQGASDALIAVGRPAEDPLLRLLRTGNDSVRLQAIRILEKIGGPNALPQLIAIAKADEVNGSLKFPARNAVLAIQQRLKDEK